MPKGVWDRKKTKEQREAEKKTGKVKAKIQKKLKKIVEQRAQVTAEPTKTLPWRDGDHEVTLAKGYAPAREALYDNQNAVYAYTSALPAISQFSEAGKALVEKLICQGLTRISELVTLAHPTVEQLKKEADEAKAAARESVKEQLRNELKRAVDLTPESAVQLGTTPAAVAVGEKQA